MEEQWDHVCTARTCIYDDYIGRDGRARRDECNEKASSDLSLRNLNPSGVVFTLHMMIKNPGFDRLDKGGGGHSY